MLIWGKRLRMALLTCEYPPKILVFLSVDWTFERNVVMLEIVET